MLSPAPETASQAQIISRTLPARRSKATDPSTASETAAAALLASGCSPSGDSPSDCMAPDGGTGCDAGDGGSQADCASVNQFCTYAPATVTTCDPPQDGLVATGCTVASGPGACSAVPHSCATSPATCPLTTALGLKADQADLEISQDDVFFKDK